MWIKNENGDLVNLDQVTAIIRNDGTVKVFFPGIAAGDGDTHFDSMNLISTNEKDATEYMERLSDALSSEDFSS